MRLNDRSDGSIKALLILGLLLANIAVARTQHRAPSQPPGSVRASRAALGASPSARTTNDVREARTLPDLFQL
jgi:hypothetical protein